LAGEEKSTHQPKTKTKKKTPNKKKKQPKKKKKKNPGTLLIALGDRRRDRFGHEVKGLGGGPNPS